MANLLPFLLLSEQQAARFRDETATDNNRLDPREVEAGEYIGMYVLPERVIYDSAFLARRDALRMLVSVQLDVDEAFLPSEEG